MGNYERTLQKRLTWAGIASLATIPITGPFGVLGAIGIFSGKGLRFLRKDAREEYFEKENTPTTSTITSFVDEGPETAIARQMPEETCSFLDRGNERRYYDARAAMGASIANNYLSSLSPEELKDIGSIEIYPEQQRKFLGIPFGRKSLEVKIKRWVIFH